MGNIGRAFRLRQTVGTMAAALDATLPHDLPVAVLTTEVIVNKRLKRSLGRCGVWMTASGEVCSMVIELSERVTRNVEACREVLLHEAAHAWTAERGLPREGHGPTWRNCCMRLGIKARQQIDGCEEWGLKDPRKVVGHCAKCGEAMMRHQRLDPKRDYNHVGPGSQCGGDIIPC